MGLKGISDSNYALQCAAVKGHIAIIELLLECPNVDHLALDCFALKLVRPHLFVLHFSAVGSNVFQAARNGRVDVFNLLLKQKGSNPASDNDYALRFACLGGHTKIVKILLSLPVVNPQAQNNTPIREAAHKGKTDLSFPSLLIPYSGHTRVVELLVAAGVDPDAESGAPLILASRAGRMEVVKYLLRQNGSHPSPPLVLILFS